MAIRIVLQKMGNNKKGTGEDLSNNFFESMSFATLLQRKNIDISTFIT